MIDKKYISEKLNISEVTSQLILNRGVETEKDLDLYINGDMDDLHDPALIPGIDEVVNKIKGHIAFGDKVTVFGDFDVDGTTASYMIYEALKRYKRSRNSDSEIEILPGNRYMDGYGLSFDAVDTMVDRDTDLLITVDCGISDHNEIEYAKMSGIDVIVIDHHESDNPPKCSFVDLKAKQGDYPFRELCGCGLAWKVGQHLLGHNFKDMIDIAAIATVADVVALKDENRIIAREGIRKIKEGRTRPGIKTLMNLLEVEQERFSSTDIGFLIGPALNAAGRLDDPDPVLDLLLEDNQRILSDTAYDLYQKNERRKRLTKRTLFSLMEEINHDDNIIIAKADMIRGIVGPVAGDIKSMFNKPAIIFDVNTGKGSARSIEPFHMYNNLKECLNDGLLKKAGGHKMAAGMTLNEERYDEFKKRMNDLADDCEYIIEEYDFEFPVSKLNKKLIREFKILEPVGQKNEPPHFLAKGVRAQDIKLTATGEHIMFKVNNMDAIAFKMPHKFDLLRTQRVDLIYQPSINYWNGLERLQIIVRDIKSHI